MAMTQTAEATKPIAVRLLHTMLRVKDLDKLAATTNGLLTWDGSDSFDFRREGDTIWKVLPQYLKNKEEKVPKRALGPFRTDVSVYGASPASGLRAAASGTAKSAVPWPMTARPPTGAS